MKKPGSGTATNNDSDWFDYKVNLRIQSIEHLQFARVLECFSGEGKLWDVVEKKTGKKIYRYKIDANYYPGVDVVGRSETVIKSISLKRYHVIDLDSWGSPVVHLQILFEQQYKGIIHCTYCSPILLNPDGILAAEYFNVDKKIIKKCSSLFAKNTGEMLSNYLKNRGINIIHGHLSEKKLFLFHNSRKMSNLHEIKYKKHGKYL